MKIKNLAVLKGEKTTIKDGVIHYTPTFKKTSEENPDVAKEPLSAEIRADVKFNQGRIKFKFKSADKETGVLITHEEVNGKDPFGAGISYAAKSFRLRYKDAASMNGSLSNFNVNEEIEICYEILGSEAKLYVNNILHCQLNINPITFPLTFRITSKGKVSVYDIEVEKASPKLFVVMQFTEEYNNFYKEVIIPVAEKAGFEVIRADEFYSSTPILNDIIKSLTEASVIIAEITPDNPNVFYEIGYAHAIKKPTILICDKKREKLPFDISSFRTLFYENTISGKSKIELNLRKYLDTILENGI